ncbi:hypothetical protein N7492_006978 [Penicillium capsulatum]|uniref:Cytochrome P450 n=1 Tax=Penicillium capsulatum TaxID=69766 RepID=A0A9W9I1E8_9EURO|nr:hypothetical protein N7492_006978 [Penicillium capsulatum]KAJ6116811.1 hypothetical protein N7512_006536 [Penicillium capsulatum]
MAIPPIVWKLILLVSVLAAVRFCYRGWRVRQLVRRTAAQHDIPLLPHSWIWGHLLVIGKLLDQLPRDTHGQYLPLLLAKEFPDLEKAGAMYIDIWPVMPPMLAVFHPDMMAEFTQTTSLPKHPHLSEEFMPFTHGNDLVAMSGQAWKTWRAILNPAFSSKNLLSLVPAFLEEIDVFVDDLKRAAQYGQTIRLEDRAVTCTIDIMGQAFVFVAKPLLVALNPLRPFRMWNNNRIIKNHLRPHIKRAIGEQRSNKRVEYKTINSVATKSYLSMADSSKSSPNDIDQKFIDVVISHYKVFFAAYDTTASTLSYAYHLLHQNPSALTALRAEHDEIFGPDPSTVRSQIATAPPFLNQLPYTTAVLKETLRLFPPAGTIREGQPGFFLTHPDTKKQYPTEGMMVYGASFAVQRREEYWLRANEFLPERWLVKEGDPLHPRKNAFRPFELGPRNCIGQELAQLELRAILALTVRAMDVESMYPEGSPTVLGEVAYQVMEVGMATGHPKLGMPVRVRMREGIEG